jgi:hypothetical protein
MRQGVSSNTSAVPSKPQLARSQHWLMTNLLCLMTNQQQPAAAAVAMMSVQAAAVLSSSMSQFCQMLVLSKTGAWWQQTP